ncbi:MAG: arsenical pump-driving ATPase [Novipirellula sp. JB048]
MLFLNSPTRNLFFTGKGGVGKTSMACAAAVQLADRGLRVLLVSTDPASNLDEVLGATLSHDPVAIESVPKLFAMNIDPEQAAHAYRERMVGPYRGVLPDAAVASMEEQFSGSCTVEIAAFDEFAKLLGDPIATSAYDHILFDTAPTGHTLRLLTLPSAWSGFMESNTSGTSCLGPLAGLQTQQTLYAQTVEALADAERTTLMLVTRPEPSAFREVQRTAAELRTLGVCNQHLIVNGVFTSQTPSDAISLAMQRRGADAVSDMPPAIRTLPRTTIPLASAGLMGVESLRRVGQPTSPTPSAPLAGVERDSHPDGLGSLIDELSAVGHGVILVMGKGGVGKTTVAAAVAVALAERGLEVHLSTTDPADHLAATITADEVAGLTVDRIDPATETADYVSEVMQTAGRDLDAEGRALLEEDLRSPCTEEIAVFRAFYKADAAGRDRIVVLDTAPTCNTIHMLDEALAYHREVSRQANQISESVQRLLPRLRDPSFTRVLVVTLPAATPVHEAAKLQADLRRAEIEPFAWVINQSLLPLQITDPALQQRQQHEWPFVDEVITQHAQRAAMIPWQLNPPTGAEALRSLTQSGVAADR